MAAGGGRVAGKRAIEVFQIKAGNHFKVGHDDAEDAARLQHTMALAQKSGRGGPGKMFEDVRRIDGFEHGVAERKRLAQVVDNDG